MKVLVFFSGGKDSQASLIWAVKEYGLKYVEAVFCDTGWEHPLTYGHIKTITDQIGAKLVTIKSQKYDGFIGLAKHKTRFPSTKARFCTEELKSKPAIDYVLEQREHLIIVEGIRKNESVSRSKMQPQCTYFKYYFEPMINGKTHSYRKKDVMCWCKEHNADKVRPVFDLSAEQVMNYIRDNGQTPNPLYYQGFRRVGCFPCIMCRHKEAKLIIDNFHDRWELLKKHEGDVGTSFFPPDYIPKKFSTGRTKDGKRYCTANDVEKYLLAKDSTEDLFEEDHQSCMSVYGLCE